ncbi:MAG: PH domain-containing protein [Thermoproteota archaeon]
MEDGKTFHADQELKTLYRIYLGVVLLVGFLSWMLPVTFVVWTSIGPETGIILTASFFVPLAIITSFVLYWIPLFHSSIIYTLEEEKIVVSRGVWWKTKSFVPYNRITNVDVYQGPISRRLGLGKLSVQTAGFSGSGSQGGGRAEATIIGMKNFEEIKDTIIDYVKGRKPQDVEAEVEIETGQNLNHQILTELRKIREALER